MGVRLHYFKPAEAGEQWAPVSDAENARCHNKLHVSSFGRVRYAASKNILAPKMYY